MYYIRLTEFGNHTIKRRAIDIHDMLEFAAFHGIKTQTQIMPMAKVNEAITKVKQGDVHYRIVLEN